MLSDMLYPQMNWSGFTAHASLGGISSVVVYGISVTSQPPSVCLRADCH